MLSNRLGKAGALVTGIVSLAACTFPGCSDASQPIDQYIKDHAASQSSAWDMSEADRGATKEIRLQAVKDMGNGVYVFPCLYFPQTLSDFRAEHPNLEIKSISQGSDKAGGNHGYASGVAQNFVVVTSSAAEK